MKWSVCNLTNPNEAVMHDKAKADMSNINFLINWSKRIQGTENPLKPFHYIILSKGYALIFALWFGLLMGFYSSAFAQSGSISGEVYDAQTKGPLQEATVHIRELSLKTTTDEQGRYVFHDIASGDYVVTIYYLGYEDYAREVTVEAGQHTVGDMELEVTFDEGDRIFESGRKREEARALNRQRQSKYISSVISSEQVDRFGFYNGYTVQDALAQFAGVQKDRQGKVNVRGLTQPGPAETNLYNVTVNGLRVASTGVGDRSVNPGMIPVDQVEEIEFIRSLTPDRFADASAGIINIRTYRNKGAKTEINAIGGGNFIPDYHHFTGPGGRISARASIPVYENISVGGGLSYNQSNFGWESLGINYGVDNFGNGPVDVINRVTPGLNLTAQENFSGNIDLTYRPDDFTTYHIDARFNKGTHTREGHSNFFDAAGDFHNPDSTGSEGGLGYYGYNANRHSGENRNIAVNLNAEHAFSNSRVNYQLGWSNSHTDNAIFGFPFLENQRGMDFEIDYSNWSTPYMRVIRPDVQDDGTIHYRNVRFQNIRRTLQESTDNKLLGNIQLEIPFNFGRVSVGSNNYWSTKEGTYNQAEFEFFRGLNLANFRPIQGGEIDVLDSMEYRIPWLINVDDALQWFRGQRGVFDRDVNEERRNSDIRNFTVNEGVFAGYGMLDVEMGLFDFLIGARLEYTVSELEGRAVEFDDNGEHVQTNFNSDDLNWLHIFPNAHLRFRATELTDVRLAYSRSISRPDFYHLVPFKIIDTGQDIIYQGNPELEPVLADNLDLSLEHYFRNVGQLRLGGYYKQLSDFVLLHSTESDGEVRQTYRNSDESAIVYGVELGWQQYLSFLPGFLSNLGTYANYTWSQSQFETHSREEEVSLPGQSPHVINAALFYTQNRISGQISYHRSASFLHQLQSTAGLAPSISGNSEIYRDHYMDGAEDLSVSLRFRISDNFRLWSDISNLLRSERRIYEKDRQLYPIHADHRRGIRFRAGVRYDF